MRMLNSEEFHMQSDTGCICRPPSHSPQAAFGNLAPASNLIKEYREIHNTARDISFTYWACLVILSLDLSKRPSVYQRHSQRRLQARRQGDCSRGYDILSVGSCHRFVDYPILWTRQSAQFLLNFNDKHRLAVGDFVPRMPCRQKLAEYRYRPPLHPMQRTRKTSSLMPKKKKQTGA